MKNLFNNISQEEKNRILEMHSGKKNVISEQPTNPIPSDCLYSAGFIKKDGGVARNQVGKPMPMAGAWEGTYQGKKARLTPYGNVSIENKNVFVDGKWKCENGKLVIYDLKTTPMPKMPF